MPLADNSFAAACYEQNSIDELREALSGPPDQADIKTWGLTAEQWRAEIQAALAAKTADAED